MKAFLQINSEKSFPHQTVLSDIEIVALQDDSLKKITLKLDWGNQESVIDGRVATYKLKPVCFYIDDSKTAYDNDHFDDVCSLPSNATNIVLTMDNDIEFDYTAKLKNLSVDFCVCLGLQEKSVHFSPSNIIVENEEY